MSVSWYPYQWSHILQYVKYAKGIAKFHDKKCFLDKNRTTTKQKSKHKNPCQSRETKLEPLTPQSLPILVQKLQLSTDKQLPQQTVVDSSWSVPQKWWEENDWRHPGISSYISVEMSHQGQEHLFIKIRKFKKIIFNILYCIYTAFFPKI